EDGIRDRNVTGVQTCALPIYRAVRVGVLGVPLHAAHVRRRAEDHRDEGEQEHARTDDDERRAPRGRTGGSGGGRGAHAGSIARAGWASWRSRSRSRSTMYWAWVAGWFPYRASLKERAPRCSGSLRWGKTRAAVPATSIAVMPRVVSRSPRSSSARTVARNCSMTARVKSPPVAAESAASRSCA